MTIVSRVADHSSRADMVCEMLRSADALIAGAVELMSHGDIGFDAGLPAEMVLMLEGRRTGSEARMIAHAAATLRFMPALAAAFRDGTVSWGQVRAIVSGCTLLRAAERSEIDRLVAARADTLSQAEPDLLVDLVDDAVARLRPDRTVAREDRGVERGFLAFQARLDGGSSFYGEADSESTATLIEALDAAAAAPKHPDEGGPSRAQQRFDALVGICDMSLAGGFNPDANTRTRPRLLATLDLSAASGDANEASLRLLWGLAGRAPRLSSVAAETLACDPTVIPVIFDGGQPVAVGDAATPVSGKVRTALVARDGGCRFPGCRAPAAWCDAHHVVPGRGRQVTDLLLLCRRCHRRVHRRRWRVRFRDHGAIDFTRRGRTYTSHPRHRQPPARE